MSDHLAALKVPAATRPRAGAVIEVTDRFCGQYLDPEYGELCRRLVARLGRKRPSPLHRGDPRIWAGAVLYTVGSLNFLFDPSQRPHLSATELCRLAGVSQATVTNKSREIRRLLGVEPFDPELSRHELREAAPWRNLVEVGGFVVPANVLDEVDDEDDDAFIESLEAADREAVDLLRRALPELRGQPPPVELAAAATRLRQRLAARDPILRPVVRANGWRRRLPSDDRQVWIESVGALIASKNETGLESEEESLLMTLEHADLLGGVLGAVRNGAGTPAGPADLADYIDRCPEVEGEVDDEDRELIEAAFELLMPTWQAAEALDAGQRLTELGRWGLPRALAWAWGGEFDADRGPER